MMCLKSPVWHHYCLIFAWWSYASPGDQPCPTGQCIPPSAGSPALHFCPVHQYHQLQYWSSWHLVTVIFLSFSTNCPFSTHLSAASDSGILPPAILPLPVAAVTHSDCEPDRKLCTSVSQGILTTWSEHNAREKKKNHVSSLAAVMDLVA